MRLEISVSLTGAHFLAEFLSPAFYSQLSHNPYPLRRSPELWVIREYGLPGSAKMGAK